MTLPGEAAERKGGAPPGQARTRKPKLGLTLLRWRSRELVRNNPYAKRAIQAISTNTTGLGIQRYAE
jgi:hypothetical protein